MAVSDTQPLSYQLPFQSVNPADPADVAIAYSTGTLVSCYLAVSTNGGSTWRDIDMVGMGGLFSVPTGGSCPQGGPVEWGPDGTIYYLYTTRTSSFVGMVNLVVSHNFGQTFSNPILVDPTLPTGWVDFDVTAAVDAHANLPSGKLYVSWGRFLQSNFLESQLMVASSTNDGASLSTPLVTSAAVSDNTNPIVVGPDGTVYIMYHDYRAQDAFTGGFPLAVIHSSDGGNTWSQPVSLGVGAQNCTPGPPKACDNLGGGVAIAPGSQPGQVVAAWAAADQDGNLRIFETQSTDGGNTWSSPQIISNVGALTNDWQFLPELSAAPDGTVSLAFYDLVPSSTAPFQTPTGTENTYLMSSSNLGQTWSAPLLVSSQASN
ncbi:MAG: sialidase family protein, partial [Acidimicrobiales bacterium]